MSTTLFFELSQWKVRAILTLKDGTTMERICPLVFQVTPDILALEADHIDLSWLRKREARHEE